MAKKTEELDETGEDKKLLVIVVNRGFAEEVVEKSRLEGATGATILQGRGSANISENFMGLNITPEKEVVLVVLDARHAAAAMKAVTQTLGITSQAGGICFCVPVNAMTKKLVEHD